MKNELNITNGDALTSYLNELNYKGEFLTWREMLCEGPTVNEINSDDFINIRASFLKETYHIDFDVNDFKNELSKLDAIDNYSEINLWFEYDLFCHINMLGVINLLHQKKINKSLYLVCSGRVKGANDLKGLAELSPTQIETHYKNRILLTEEDIDIALSLWQIYNGKDHNLLKPFIVKSSSFEYMGNCLKAHLRRYPHQHNGLSMLEENILKIIKNETIKSVHHLLGYSLNYQGFYGFGDIQLKRIINSLSIFFDSTENQLVLNRKGHEALLGQHNYKKAINSHISFGGVNSLDYQFSIKENKLVKTL